LSRQDYYFRYNVGCQLHVVGESLMGWMAWDLMRGVDLLLSREGVDPNRVILVGAVAGGGDPAGVTAALDRRIQAVAPFNFGGPQPDYAIPADAENEFYFFGVAYWEMTRCLRLGGRDGFAHWLIAGSVAPRRLSYSHEFHWDSQRDPVWPRLQKVFSLYDAPEHLQAAMGRGTLQGQPPESTHCNNVGPVHRRHLYQHWAKWFDMPIPDEEFQQRRDASELMCLTPELIQRLRPQPVHQLADQLGQQRVQEARRQLDALEPAARRGKLRADWARLLGEVEPRQAAKVVSSTVSQDGNVRLERVLLEVEDDILVPLVLLSGKETDPDRRRPLVVMFSASGMQTLLGERADEVAQLLSSGAVVCLVDPRGIGQTRPGSSDGPHSTMTTLSCREQVLGQTLTGSQLRDVRSVVRYLRQRTPQVGTIALWGDSTAETNPADRSEVVPQGVDNPNVQGEPTAGLIALLAALFEEDVDAVYARGTLASHRSLLSSPFLYVPHQAIIPGALQIGDIADLVAALAPRPVRMDAPIDGLNRPLPLAQTQTALAPALDRYRQLQAAQQLQLTPGDSPSASDWMLQALSATPDAGIR
jgi:hypothetical protein